jgi:hypothetical protein
MKRRLPVLGICALLSACGAADSTDPAADGAERVAGPFPARVHGTIGYSFPLEDGSRRIKLGLLEYGGAAIIVAGDVYDAKKLDDEDEPEVDFTVSPIESPHCDADEQCLEGR